MDPVELPDDPALLKSVVAALLAQVEELQQDKEVLQQDKAAALEELAQLKRRLFGRKSERLSENDEPSPQLSLLAELSDPTANRDPASGEEGEPDADSDHSSGSGGRGRRRRRQGGRSRIPPHVGRVEVSSDAPGPVTCSCCGGPLRTIGEDRSERLEYIPGHFKVFVVVRKKRACPSCPAQGVITQPAPPFALDRAKVADGLLAKIITDKFGDHIPLHRQSRRFQRHGVHVAVPTMCGWLRQVTGLLKYIVATMQRELVAGPLILSDGTGLPILEGPKNKPVRGTLWSYSDGTQVVFEATKTGQQDHPASFLKGFEGVLLTDGASVYNLVARSDGVDRAGCWAHARRKFFDAREAEPERAMVALAYIREIFDVEREAKAVSIEARQRIREERLRPRLGEFRAWLDEQSQTARPSSALGKAITYARNQWKPLVVFLDDGRVPAHNNTSERLLRGPVVGRKNWLFAGSEGGAAVAATCFSIVASCIMAGLDPYDYLRDVLHRLPDARPADINALTPLAWARRHGPRPN